MENYTVKSFMWHFGLRANLDFPDSPPPQKNSKPRKRLWAKSWSKHFSPKSAKILRQSGRRKKKESFVKKLNERFIQRFCWSWRKKRNFERKQKLLNREEISVNFLFRWTMIEMPKKSFGSGFFCFENKKNDFAEILRLPIRPTCLAVEP